MEDLRPNTIDHFRYWASLTTVEKRDEIVPWELEEFQVEILSEVFAGYREVVALLPTGSYKTTTFGGLGVYHMQFTPGAKVPLGAAAKPQAAILYEQAAGFVTRSKFLQLRFSVRDGTKSVIGKRGTPLYGRWMRVFSASDDTGDGIIPTLALIDELHRHKGHDLYGTWREKLTKTDGTLVALSTAGDSEDNPLEQLRDAAMKLPDIVTTGRHTVARSKGREFCMHGWWLRPEDDVHDLKIVKLANPASQVTLEELRMRRDSPSTKPYQWKRFTCNLRAKGEDSAITPEDFDDRRFDDLVIPQTAPVLVGLDIAWKIDHTAIAPLGWESAKRRLIEKVITIAPPVDEATIVAGLLRLNEHYDDLRGYVYDPNSGGRQMVQQLEKGTHELQTNDEAREAVGLPPLGESKSGPLVFIEHAQDNAPMSLAAIRFDEAFGKGWIRHDGSNVCSTPGCGCGGFRGHVINAVTKTLGGEKWRYDRPSDAKGGKRAKHPIDGLTAILMAHSIAVAEFGEGTSKINIDDYRISRV